MNTVTFPIEQPPAFHDTSFYRFSILSIIAHGMILAGICLVIQSRSHDKHLHLPQTITLISMPVAEKPIPPAPQAPQRVQTATPQKAIPPPPVASPPIKPATISNPVSSDVNPVPSTTPAQQETGQQAGQSGEASGGVSQASGGGDNAIRMGSAQMLDNVGFSPLYNPKPAFPPVALKAGIQGSVEVDLLISEFGRVESFTIEKINGHPSFGDETAKVIGKWRFPPPRVKGKKIKVKYLYTVNFTLD